MKIAVRLTPGAKKNSVEKSIDLLGNDVYLVRVKARPVDGEANKMLITVLAEHFNMPKRLLSLVHGAKSRNKIVEIRE